MLPVLLPVLPPAPLELDLLKCASHSAWEIWPSLFVSTEEKLGVAVLALAALPPEALDDALGRLDEPVEELPDPALPLGEEVLDDPLLGELDEPLELPPAAEGEEEDLSLLVLPDDELCAAATPDSANSAAAVATLTNFRFNIGWISLGEVGKNCVPASCKTRAPCQLAGAAFAVAERCHNACLQR